MSQVSPGPNHIFQVGKQPMKAKVTEHGVVIPREFLEGVKEVEIQKQNELIVVMPISMKDPIYKLGSNPVNCDAPQASELHDKYIYDTSS
jgi:hypothetical protein